MICLAHEELSNYFKVNFLLQRHHNYTLTELDMMIPWEKEVHTILLLQAMEEEKEALVHGIDEIWDSIKERNASEFAPKEIVSSWKNSH